MNTPKIRLALRTWALISGLAVMVTACSSSNSNNKPTPSNGGASAAGGSSDGGSPGATGGSSNGGNSATGGESNGGGTGCVQLSSTNPTNNQLMNACSGAYCQSYDNAANGVPNPLPAIQ